MSTHFSHGVVAAAIDTLIPRPRLLESDGVGSLVRELGRPALLAV
jgi:hypothetical protein